MWSQSLQNNTVESKNASSEKGICLTLVFKALWITPPLYSLFSGCSDCFHGLLCPVSREGKEACDCFWEFDGWRTYWHNYCLTQPLFLSSSFKMEERAAAVLAGFYPVFSSFNLFPFLYFSPFSFISNNFVSIYTVLYIPSTPPSPYPSQHDRVQSALIALTSPGFPLRWVQSSLQQCNPRTCSHKGRKNNVCVTNNAASMLCISI